MASLTLSKGSNLSLTKADPGLQMAMVGLGWDPRTTSGHQFDLDASALLVTASGKVYTETGATFTASDEQKENVTVVEDVKALTFTFHPNGVRLPTAPRLTRPSPPSPIPTPRRRPVSSNPATPSADGADLAPMAPIRRTPPLPHSGRATAPAMAAAAPAVPAPAATQFPSPLPPTEA